MPRAPRMEYEDACYHVMARGNRWEPSVFDDEHCKLFESTLAEAAERHFGAPLDELCAVKPGDWTRAAIGWAAWKEIALKNRENGTGAKLILPTKAETVRVGVSALDDDGAPQSESPS